ncbi:MAG: XdhC family protein, partial [Bacillota bacterium]
MKFIYEYVLNALSAGERAALVTLVDVAGEGEGVFLRPGSKLFWSRRAVAGSLGSDWLDRAALDLAARALQSGVMEKVQVPSPAGAAGRCTLVAEPFFTSEELVILGGGNIARPLVKVAAMLGYAVTVVDDRPEFASRERFPEARQVICADFEQALENL